MDTRFEFQGPRIISTQYQKYYSRENTVINGKCEKESAFCVVTMPAYHNWTHVSQDIHLYDENVFCFRKSEGGYWVLLALSP